MKKVFSALLMIFNASVYASERGAQGLMSASSKSLRESLRTTLNKNSVLAWEAQFKNDGVEVNLLGRQDENLKYNCLPENNDFACEEEDRYFGESLRMFQMLVLIFL